MRPCTSTVNGTELTVASTAGDAITIAANGANVTVNGNNVGGANPATLTKITVNADTGANTISLVGVTKAAFPRSRRRAPSPSTAAAAPTPSPAANTRT